MDQNQPYRVTPHDSGSYRVLDATGQTVCSCHDADNAQHYATLLNQAYRRGYKAGYRAAKQAELG